MQLTFPKAISQLYKTWKRDGRIEAHVAIDADKYLALVLTHDHAHVELHHLDEPLPWEPVANPE